MSLPCSLVFQVVIREALGRALVHYYPMAGRLREGHNRKLMVDCNGEGVLFVEATAGVTLEELGDAVQPPCPLLEEFLCDVPGSDGILGCPLLLIQVTLLRCGGFILALRLNHTICDGAGVAQFLNTVGEMAQGKNEPSIPPVWEREVLNARDPPRITRMHHEFEEIIDYSDQSSAAAEMVQKSFYFGPKEITALKKHLTLHLSSCSRFDLITSCLWKCRTVALEHNPKQENEDGILVPVCLPLKSMERFQQELKRMTSLENMENIDNNKPAKIMSML
ncbi:hypothetical protein M0R45_025414 [Rubus argutus]|uniref:Uncharacterized protein n=1 Tax=Rubus argutus TaxID=59490 RepID=A0AAW1WUJ4_RUBAR